MRHAALLSIAVLTLTAAGCESGSSYPAYTFTSPPPRFTAVTTVRPASTPVPTPAPTVARPVSARTPTAASTILATDQTFDRELAGSTVPVVINFTAKWCSPCHALAPVIDTFAAENAGRVKVIRVDFDQSPSTARRYNVSALPAVLWVKNGVVVKRTVGFQSRDRLNATFASVAP
jgi:thioredoxin 1